MAKRKKSSSSEYSINHAELTGYSASIDASINHNVREPRYYEDDAKVYDFAVPTLNWKASSSSQKSVQRMSFN